MKSTLSLSLIKILAHHPFPFIRKRIILLFIYFCWRIRRKRWIFYKITFVEVLRHPDTWIFCLRFRATGVFHRSGEFSCLTIYIYYLLLLSAVVYLFICSDRYTTKCLWLSPCFPSFLYPSILFKAEATQYIIGE